MMYETTMYTILFELSLILISSSNFLFPEPIFFFAISLLAL